MLWGMGAPAQDLTSTWLDTLSQRYRTAFAERNLIVRRSHTVHDVAWTRGIGGREWPVAACRVGVAGMDPEILHPTTLGVTCGRCLHNGGRRATPEGHPEVPGQLALDLDALDDD